MDIKTFCEDVRECLQAVLGNDAEVNIYPVNKNNGVCLYSMIIRYAGEQCTPSIYMEDYFRRYQLGRVEMEEIVSEILDLRKKMEAVKMEPILELSWEKLKDRVFCCLVNRDMNREKLKSMPHKEYLDLAVIYRFLHKRDETGIASSVIDDSVFHQLGISKEELDAQAQVNTQTLFPVRMQSLLSVVQEMQERMVEQETNREEECDMYILTNQEGINGASVILYPDVLKEIAEELNAESVFLLPSSIHEVIILPIVEENHAEALKEMVQNVNDTVVTQTELLSNHVYQYDRDTDSIKIAA